MNGELPSVETMTTVLIVGLSLTVGVLVGLLGIGGGVVLVPALVYLLHYGQHMAQGTSLFILLPPIGLGALRKYWKNGQVDLRAGIYCALGFLIGGYGGGESAGPGAGQGGQKVFLGFLGVFGAGVVRETKHVVSPQAVPARSAPGDRFRGAGSFS